MARDRFEEDIKNRLEQHLEQYDSSAWDRLAQQLDQEESIPEEDIDDLSSIASKLANHQEHMPDDHWQLMKKELDELDARREALWTMKLIEFSIFLLLLLTYWNIAGHRHFYTNRSAQNIASTTDLLLKDDEFYIRSSAINQEDFKISDEVSSVTIAPGSETNTESLTENVINNNPATSSASISENSILLPLQELSQISHRKFHVPFVESRHLRPLHSEITLPVIHEPGYFYNTTSTVADNDPKNNGLWMSISFSRDVNLINSSLDLYAIRSHILSGDHGISVGLNVSYQINNFELESGIRYSEKTFNPGLIRAFSKASYDTYLETQLEQIKFRQFQLPVIARFHAYNDTRNNLYAFGGVGVNAIMDYQYTTEKTVQPSARVTALDDYNTLNLSSLAKGVSEGGPLRDNIYVSGILGVGFQTVLENQTALFFQPQYEFSIGSGANDYIQRVHSFSIQGGLRFKF